MFLQSPCSAFRLWVRRRAPPKLRSRKKRPISQSKAI